MGTHPAGQTAPPRGESAATAKVGASPGFQKTRKSLAELRLLLRSEPPVGREVAQACRYDPGRLAELCDCSMRRVQQVFREVRRCTPHHWLQEQKLLVEWETLTRLDAAGELTSLKTVVADWGYSSLANFYRAFERVFERPPKAFLAEREAALKQVGIDLSAERARFCRISL